MEGKEVNVTQVNQQQLTGEPAQERLVIASAAIEAGTAPSSVVIAPWGEVKSANGTFVMDEQSAQLVIEAFKAHGTDIPIDYEHQSLGGSFASPSGQAPAAGWIKNLAFVSPGQAGESRVGLVAEVAWTEPAREKLIAREYRYLSPVVMVRRGDRRVTSLHSAALTNKPAIVGAKPIVNSCADSNTENDLPNSDPAASGRLDTAGSSEAVEVLRMRLGLPGDCSVEQLLVSAEQRLAALVQEAAGVAAERRVAAAVAAGKLTPAQHDWAMQLALKDPATFDAWVESAPQVVVLGQTRGPTGVAAGGRDRNAIAAAARAYYHSEPGLAVLTSEDAWVADALREAGYGGDAGSQETGVRIGGTE